MKVLQVNSVCGIRSTGRICTDLADILQKNGDDCRVAYGRESVPASYSHIAISIGNRFGVCCHGAMSRVFDNTGCGSYYATKKLLHRIDSFDPDVIHLHNLHGYYIHLELLFDYLKARMKPVVWTLHDCWAFTGHCAHFEMINCTKWENGGCHSCAQKRRYPSSFLIDRSRRNYIDKKRLFTGLKNLTVVTPSDWLADLTRRSFLGKYPIRTIHNGIDLSVFRPTPSSSIRRKYGLDDRTIFLGVASAWTESKGLFDFYKMNEMKSDREVIVLVGLTKKQLAELPHGIVGIMRTNSISELAEIYSAADVFLNPTYEETFGLTNIEAQACGTPAVTYCAGGSPEGVPADNVVERGDVEALWTKAHDLVKLPQVMDVSSFSKENSYARYMDLYRQITD